ncbi:MAG: right-handed parallel beta-helix repeat-containing protein [Bacteroidetes bacterium]|nr:right-handed parallel beta-helix repeat-containing protein [Bacteroidota bacterium]
MRWMAIVLLGIYFSPQSQAKIWRVGPARTYTKPSQVSTLVSHNDTVYIDAGIYDSDVCAWTKNNLVLKGSGGIAHMRSNGLTWGGKAIWVISGKNAWVDSIEFSKAACVDLNGAGIRLEGTGLTVSHCYFHDNENGILTGVDTQSHVLIQYSEFYNNGYGDGYSHNLYIGHIHTLTFQYNYSHHTKVGHELKSRAHNNYILYNRFDEGSTGTASRSIDLPNGGLAVIMGNEIIKGIQSQNSNLVGYGMEGLSNPAPHQFYLVHNTLVNQRNTGIFTAVANGTALCFIRNNIFSGPGSHTLNTPLTADTGNNKTGAISGMKFLGTVNKEYFLTAVSPAVNTGSTLGSAGTFSLSPTQEYLHPQSYSARTIYGNPDAGAHEFTNNTGVKITKKKLTIYPNPCQKYFMVPWQEKCEIQFYSMQGARLYQCESTQDGKVYLPPHLQGVLMVYLIKDNQNYFEKIHVAE